MRAGSPLFTSSTNTTLPAPVPLPSRGMLGYIRRASSREIAGFALLRGSATLKFPSVLTVAKALIVRFSGGGVKPVTAVVIVTSKVCFNPPKITFQNPKINWGLITAHGYLTKWSQNKNKETHPIKIQDRPRKLGILSRSHTYHTSI